MILPVCLSSRNLCRVTKSPTCTGSPVPSRTMVGRLNSAMGRPGGITSVATIWPGSNGSGRWPQALRVASASRPAAVATVWRTAVADRRARVAPRERVMVCFSDGCRQSVRGLSAALCIAACADWISAGGQFDL